MPDFALEMVKSAKKSILATSYVQFKEWWDEPWGKRYEDLNRDAVQQRHVDITRIFIFSNTAEFQNALSHLKAHKQDGIKIEYAMASNLNVKITSDMVVVDDRLAGELRLTPDKGMKEAMFYSNSQDIQQYRTMITDVENQSETFDKSLASGLSVRVDGSVTSRRDELAELGRDFNRMAQRIDELVMAHRRLLTDVSHTLRSPLARLNVALGLARQRTAPEASQHLDRIGREADRLNTLIGQLLTLARIDSDVDPQRKALFDLATLVQEVAADGDYEARGCGCTVTFAPCHECLLEGIPEMLRVAIENVIRNAVRHTAEGTDVQIGIELQSAKGSRKAIIQVLDHGTGVPEEELASIFLPFHRSAEGICRDPDGAGLGLAITERAFRFHGGTTAAANNPAGGLVVTLELPLLDSRCRTEEVSQRGSHGVGMSVPLGEGSATVKR